MKRVALWSDLGLIAVPESNLRRLSGMDQPTADKFRLLASLQQRRGSPQEGRARIACYRNEGAKRHFQCFQVQDTKVTV